MQLVVVMAVRKAVSAATTTFTAISMILFFIRFSIFYVCFTYGVVALLTGERPRVGA